MDWWQLTKDLATFGGSSRLKAAAEDLQHVKKEFEDVRCALLAKQVRLKEFLADLEFSFARTKKALNKAHRIIYPTQSLPLLQQQSSTNYDARSGVGLTTPSAAPVNMAKFSNAAAVSTFAGTSAAILAWQGVQLLGTASTGVSIAGLHGVAAANAGWAAFGGGSLASGGGGMALGHVVLPGIGLAVAVGVATVSTHIQAGDMEKEVREIRLALATNSKSLRQTQAYEADLQRGKARFDFYDQELREAVQQADRRLRPYGFLSTAFRHLRHYFTGAFYTAEEARVADALEQQVSHFMKAFGVKS